MIDTPNISGSKTIAACVILALAATTAAYAKRPVVPPEPLRLYEGAPLPLDQIASIGTGFNLRKHAGGQVVGIVMIDGKIVMDDNMGVHVLPGEHEFMFMSPEKFGPVMKSTKVTLKLTVEAGHSYVTALTKEDGADVWTPLLKDAGTQYDQRCMVGSYADKSKTRASAVGCL